MDSVEVARRRRQMGESLADWAAISGSVHALGQGYWAYLSGLPSADTNMGLIHGSDREEFANLLAMIDDVGAPTLLLSAGAGVQLAEQLGAGWSHVGAAPFMAIELAAGTQQGDERVRQATDADVYLAAELMADAFVLPRAVCKPLVHATVHASIGPMAVWVLEDNGEAVSTAITSWVDDAVTIWCMATPARFTRRGYARALLAEALLHAYSYGARVGLLSATPAGRPLYEATGWQTLEDWKIHTNGASAQFE
jgi:GNAT superfamily N-acetyltransferase